MTERQASESYHERNNKVDVKYPYVTYDFDSDSLERNLDGFYIDVSEHCVQFNISTFTPQLLIKV